MIISSSLKLAEGALDRVWDPSICVNVRFRLRTAVLETVEMNSAELEDCGCSNKTVTFTSLGAAPFDQERVNKNYTCSSFRLIAIWCSHAYELPLGRHNIRLVWLSKNFSQMSKSCRVSSCFQPPLAILWMGQRHLFAEMFSWYGMVFLIPTHSLLIRFLSHLPLYSIPNSSSWWISKSEFFPPLPKRDHGVSAGVRMPYFLTDRTNCWYKKYFIELFTSRYTKF